MTGIKYDGAKPRWDLMYPAILQLVAEGYTKTCSRYASDLQSDKDLIPTLIGLLSEYQVAGSSQALLVCFRLLMRRTDLDAATEHTAYDYSNWYAVLPMDVIEDMCVVLAYGAATYSASNWAQVKEARGRYYAATFRHVRKWSKGEVVDADTNKSHLVHALCNIMFLLAMELKTPLNHVTNPLSYDEEVGVPAITIRHGKKYWDKDT